MIFPEQLKVFVCESLGLPVSTHLELVELPVRGSDRSFFRLVRDNGNSVIFINYDPARIENNYYADIAVFLSGIDVPVPAIYGHDPDRCFLVMEDAGSVDLWTFRTLPWEKRHTLYCKTLEAVQRLHSFPIKDFPSEKVRLMDGFNAVLYRWERDYFLEHFVTGVCGIVLETSRMKALEDELSALANRIGETTLCLVHRDLQSQNVMIREGEPVLIDFQGMRFGSRFYDLGSLLNDPYVMLSEEEVIDLLNFYYGISGEEMDWPQFVKCFREASAQRLMQALGAYGFLGKTRGLKTFLGHVPAGLAMLQRTIADVSALPLLRQLAEECRNHLKE